MDKKIIVAVSAFLENNLGQFLILKRSEKSSWGGGQWQLPEGKMEWGETPLQTIERETKEETGCVPIDLKFVGLDTGNIQAKGIDFHVLRIFYKGKISGEIKLSEDHSAFKFVSICELLTENIASETKDFIKLNLP